MVDKATFGMWRQLGVFLVEEILSWYLRWLFFLDKCADRR